MQPVVDEQDGPFTACIPAKVILMTDILEHGKVAEQQEAGDDADYDGEDYQKTCRFIVKDLQYQGYDSEKVEEANYCQA